MYVHVCECEARCYKQSINGLSAHTLEPLKFSVLNNCTVDSA